MRNSKWTQEKIRMGFVRFQEEYGRLPTAKEVDRTAYLPSSRWVQLKYGGLERLRILLGFEQSHFGKGIHRSHIAHRVNDRGRKAEQQLEVDLRSHFGEVFVHTEKMFGDRKYRVDFYVYSPDGNFGVDIFYPDTMYTLQSNVNIKMNKYRGFSNELFLVVANQEIHQLIIDDYVVTKTRTMPSNVKLITLENFLRGMRNKRAYSNPLAV